MSHGDYELDEGLQTPDMDFTPHDHRHGDLPAGANTGVPKGPPPPPGAFMDYDTLRLAADEAGSSREQRAGSSTQPTAQVQPAGEARSEAAAPKTGAAGSRGLASTASSSPAVSSDSDEQVSYSWSETSLFLEGHPFEEAVERLHSLYRQELQTRRVPGRSQAGCLAGLRRRTNRSNWYQVQAEARQRLTGARLEEWNQFEYAATHAKRRRRRERSRSPRPAADR